MARPSATSGDQKKTRFAALLALIDARRQSLRLSREQVCRRASLGPDCIRSIANGHQPRADTLVAIARVLGLDAADLFGALDQGAAAPTGFAESEPADALGSARHRRPGVAPEYFPHTGNAGHVAVAAPPGGSCLGEASRPGRSEGERVMLFPDNLIRHTLAGEATDFYWAEVVGNAMHPELAEGERLLIDRRAVRPTDPGMFAVDEGLGLTARWIEYIPSSQPPRYRMRSLGPRFAPYEVAAERIRVLGRIVWVGRLL